MSISDITSGFKSPSSGSHSAPTTFSLAPLDIPLCPRPLAALTPDPEDQALAFFVSNYVLQHPGGNPFDVSNTSKLDVETHEKLLLIMDCGVKAIGLSNISTIFRVPEFSSLARKKYLTAVSHLNSILASSHAVQEDLTLFNVMLLCLFETVALPNERSLADWSRHINGAGALLKLRGAEQLQTTIGIRLFMQTAMWMTVMSLRLDLPLPHHILELTFQTTAKVRTEDFLWRFFVSKMRFVQFYSEQIVEKSDASHDEIVDMALDLEKELKSLFFDPVDTLTFQTVYLPHSSSAGLDGRCDVYKTYMAVQVYNDFRVMRIMLHRIIRGIIKENQLAKDGPWSPSRKSLQMANSFDTIVDLQKAILASAPQHFGLVKYDEHGAISFENKAREKSPLWFPWTNFKHMVVDLARHTPEGNQIPRLRLFGGQVLHWCLYTAGRTDETDGREIQKEAIKLLLEAGEPMGNHQAVTLAEELRSMAP